MQIGGYLNCVVSWEARMQIRVRPAKREGSSRTIFHRSLLAEDIKPGKAEEACVVLSIDTAGIYPEGSTYKYELEFTAEELRALIAVTTGHPPSTGTGCNRSVTHTESGESASPILR